jgi:transcription-repair coupling factor (superfamily II helicase)
MTRGETRHQKGAARSGPPPAKPRDLHAIGSRSPLGMIALYLLEEWRRLKQRGLIFISEDDWRAERLGAIMYALEPGCGVMVLPRLETLPFEGIRPSAEISGRRASVLRKLAETPTGALLILSPEALTQRVPEPIRWAHSSLRLRKHDTFKEEVVRQFLEGAGYSLDERVEIPGSALFLGQMLEVYPAGALGPVRLEYSNDKVLEITAYDPASQRRLAEIDELVLDVTSEWVERPTCDADGSKPMQPDGSTIDSVVLDYAPSARIIADFGVRTRARSWIQQIDEQSFEESPRAARQQYLTREEWEAYLRKRKGKSLPESAPFEQVPRFAGSASPGGSFRKFVEEQEALGRHVVFTAATERDLRTMDRRAGSQSLRCHSWRDVAKAGCADRRSLLVDLDRGFVDGRRKVALITAQDLLGSRASHPQPMASKGDSATDLAPGDAVIHFNRGLAILHGQRSGLQKERCGS